MKKSLFLLIIFIIIVIAAIVLRLSGSEDAWLCRNGEWIKHGQPFEAKPSTPCWPDNSEPVQIPNDTPLDESDNATSSEVLILQPQPNTLVVSPLTVKGQARGGWFFEASLPVKLVDANYQVIVAHYGTAESDWMTTEFVPFSSILEFSTTATSGFLIISKDNPSGLPEYDAAISWPVNFK